MAETDIPTTEGPINSPRKAGSPLVRTCLFWLGVFLVVISPLVGVLPGPGGVFVFAAGAGLMLKNSKWAKKLYARLKKRHPKKAAWTDWSLRRRSAARRVARDKALEMASASADIATPDNVWDTAPHPQSPSAPGLAKPGDGNNG